ncbi:MAG: PLP-dependent aminotransferase family protein [Verrucomicrobiota bacterium]|jgi:2-aminoadipate transaminase
MKHPALSALGQRATEPPISWLMHTALSRPKLISLAAGFTDNPSLPLAETRALLHGLLRSPQSGRPALQYGSTAGDPILRELTAAHVLKLDAKAVGAMECWRNGASKSSLQNSITPLSHSPARMLISGGSQQLLYLVTEALCDEGDMVLVEDPTYFVYLGIVQNRGLRARGVRLQRDGLDLAHLESVLQSLKRRGELPRVKLLYLVSYLQNPTGVTTGFEKKRAILKLLQAFEGAAGHPIYLLEDAAYRELRFSGGDVPSALAVRGAAERVIYTGTFSKPFATGARVGFGILPGPLFATVKHIKGNHDFGTANLLQQLYVRALKSGIYETHVARLQMRYAQKARVMRLALERHFPPAVEWWGPEGGLYFWARLPGRLASGVKSKVFQTALKNDVLYVPGGICYADDPTRRKPDHEMRISFGNASESDIREGIRRLGAVLRKLV